MSEYNYNEKYFEIIDTENKAYWLGFLYADGYIEPIYRKEKIKAFRIELGLSSLDECHLEKFLLDLSSNAPITQRIQKINNEEYNSSRVRINNTKMCKDLIKLGCTTKKSLTLEFPNSDIVPIGLLSHFIRGYFDGDGCIHYSERNYIDKRNNKEYVNKQLITSLVGTSNFLEELLSILKNANINFDFCNSNCGKALEIRVCRHNDILNFYSYIYNNANIFLSRKKDKFEYAFQKLNIIIPASLL